MIIDLCFSSDDEKEKEKDTGPIDLCSPDASEDEGEPARAAEPARAEEPARQESAKREAPASAGHIIC